MTPAAPPTPGELHPFPALNPDLNQILLVVGRKGSGKSVNARELFRDWPYIDKFVIDPTGDADPGDDIGTITLHELPRQLPAPQRNGEFTVTRWVANPASATYQEDLDRAVGLALHPKTRRVLLWVDEAGVVFPAGQTGPNGRLLLQQSRHYYASVLLCCPRPMKIDPLCLAQADRVVMYDLPGAADRKRVAETIGIELDVLRHWLNEVRRRGEHHFLLYDAREHALYLCPPLPIERGTDAQATR